MRSDVIEDDEGILREGPAAGLGLLVLREEEAMPERAMEETAAAVKRPMRSPEPAPHAHVLAPGAAGDAAGARVPGAPSAVLAIQRAAGNQAVMRMLDAQRPGHPLAGPSTAVQRSNEVELDDDEDVQRSAAALHEPSDEAIRSAAAEGVRTPATTLPHLDRIQASFGRHSIAHVQAHVGPEATRASRAMNALAYASGNHVVFGATPDLRTAAHEAAHIVQQQAGVQLSGGIGRAGDPYERHADAVANAVVAGRSAEGLLEPFAGTKVKQRDDRRNQKHTGERFNNAGNLQTMSIAMIAQCHSFPSITTHHLQQQSGMRQTVQMMRYFFWEKDKDKPEELKGADVKKFVIQNAQHIKKISTARHGTLRPRESTIYIRREGETPAQSDAMKKDLEKIHPGGLLLGGQRRQTRTANPDLTDDNSFIYFESLDRRLNTNETFRLLVNYPGLPRTNQLLRKLKTYARSPDKREFKNIKTLVQVLQADGVFTFSVADQAKAAERIRRTSNFANAYIVIDTPREIENKSLPLQESGQVGASIYAIPSSNSTINTKLQSDVKLSQSDSEVGLLRFIHDYLLGNKELLAQLKKKKPRIYIRIFSNMGSCDGCKLRIENFKNNFKDAAKYGDDKLAIDIYYTSEPGRGRGNSTTYGWLEDEQVPAGLKKGKMMYQHINV